MQAMSKRQGEVTQSINPDTFRPASAPLSNNAVMGFNPVTAGV
jgi:salicylate hydroxylase